jgi:ATP-dependent 26S proteasome regulatory subunit
VEFVNGRDKQCITLASDAADLSTLQKQIDEELRLRNPYRGKFIHVMEDPADGIRFEILSKPVETMDDLILDSAVKTDLLDNTLLQLQLGMNNGLIFAGAPGTGKSLAAKTICRSVLDAGYSALFAEGRVSFERLDEMVRQFIGPCVIVLEDIDTFAEDRIKGRPTAFADFLQFMSGMAERPDPIVVVATTNHLELLDAAVKNRPARFNRRYDFKAPDNVFLDQMIDAMFGPGVIPAATKSLCHDRDFTGAHINEIRRTAKTIAHKLGKPVQEVFAEAVDRVSGHFSPELKMLGFAARKRG